MTAGTRDIGHADIALAVPFDQRHPLAPLFFKPAIANADLVQKAAVRVAQQFEMRREHAAEKFHGPFFNCLRKQGRVGI